MKVTFSQEGLLVVSPSNSIESYALDKWKQENDYSGIALVVEIGVKTKTKKEKSK